MKKLEKYIIGGLVILCIVFVVIAIVFFNQYNDEHKLNETLKKNYNEAVLNGGGKKVKVLYATEEIAGNTQLCAEVIGIVEIDEKILKKFPGVVQNVSQITDEDGELYYVDFDSTIPKGSLLFKDVLISKNDKPDSKLELVPDGYRYYYLDVDMTSTLGNVIVPGASVDIYAYVETDEGKMFGKLYQNINVIDVVDKNWTTTSGSKNKKPEILIALVPEDVYRFLEKAKRVNGVELIIAPNNKSFENNEVDTELTSLEIKMFVESKFIALSDN